MWQQYSLEEGTGRLIRVQDTEELSPTMQRVRETGYRALQQYRPAFYSGKINFVRAEISLRLPDDPVAVWSKLAGKVEVETVPGDHKGVVTTHCKSLADVLSNYLQEAFHERTKQEQGGVKR
jgi:hypothetical protein